jgi:hypothetical protein
MRLPVDMHDGCLKPMLGVVVALQNVRDAADSSLASKRRAPIPAHCVSSRRSKNLHKPGMEWLTVT